MRKTLILGATLLISTTSLLAQTPQQASYLPTAEAVRRLMDGKPWDGLAPNGRKARIILNKDGTGRFEGGPMAMPISWTVERDDICLNLGMAGIKCVRFVAVANGYQAYAAGKPDLAFTR